MAYLPGSHRVGLERFVDISHILQEPYDIVHDPAVSEIQPVWVEAEPGSVVFHHSLTISPIAKNYKKKNGQPDSRCDYNEQMERKLNGYSLMWDDTPQNSSRVGEFFGFYRYKIDVSIHMILHIADSEANSFA